MASVDETVARPRIAGAGGFSGDRGGAKQLKLRATDLYITLRPLRYD